MLPSLLQVLDLSDNLITRPSSLHPLGLLSTLAKVLVVGNPIAVRCRQAEIGAAVEVGMICDSLYTTQLETTGDL